jgi:Calcineurin-like phosphoesterase
VELGSSTYCMPPCSGSTSCSSGTCTNVTAFDGTAVQACVPSDSCGNDGNDAGPQQDSSVPYDAGDSGAVTGTVGPSGGTVSRLFFSVVGDTRPPTYEDLAGYPTSIITQIYQDIEAFSPKPEFVVATGDYQFSSTGSGSTAPKQLALYAGAAKSYSGVVFPAMGNHECTGADDSNCPISGSPTANYSAFLSTLLTPISQTKPYFVINVNSTTNAWTAKFVFIAANAWDSTQSAWLTSAMAVTTTYTFVIRHEPPDASPAAPGIAPSESIIASYPYTLELVGHSHTYGHYTTPYPREVIVGNGGAPLSGSKDYGFAILSQRSDGAIVGDMLDYKTLTADSYFHFVVEPNGTLTN